MILFKMRLMHLLAGAAISACILFSLSGCMTSQQETARHWKNYYMALSHGDLGSAIVEVNAICALDTSSQSSLDTLMRLYYLSGNFVSTYKVGEKLREKKTIHKKFMAESALKLGFTSEAKQWMIDIEENDSAGLNIASKFKLASIHYNDQEFEEAIALLGKIVDDDASFELRTKITGDSSVEQEVSYYAASHNFAGFVFLNLENYESAEAHFREALRVQPDFQLAKNNLAELSRIRDN